MARSLPRILIDCRWTNSGAGRMTQLLLRGLSELKTEVQWLLWGPREIETLAWPGTEVIVDSTDPMAMRGQRSWLEIPSCDLALFMHQQRPLRRIPAVTLIYDTIPLRYAKNIMDRQMKLIFLRRVAAISRQLITISNYSRDCIMRDLGVPADKVTLVRQPFDESFVQRILKLRPTLDPMNQALFVGNFLPHKNLRGLIAAFGETRFRAAGGKLLLVGGSSEEVQRFRGELSARERSFVELRGQCDQAQLDKLFASSLFLVQPSLEEGFGLPAWEALCCGLPVCVSDGGSLPEATQHMVDPFPAGSIDEMTTALDRCASTAIQARGREGQRISDQLRQRAPTVAEYASQFVEIALRNLR